jgi:hypothetical protein
MVLGYFLRYGRDLSVSGAVVLALLVTAGTRVRTGVASCGWVGVGFCAAVCGARLPRLRDRALESRLLAT